MFIEYQPSHIDIDHTSLSSSDDTDELSKLKTEAVPDDVRKWLASTFASADQV